jgi:hypothetical protein
VDLTTREPQVMVGRTVKIATVTFALAVGVHGLDHLRRGLDVVRVQAGRRLLRTNSLPSSALG